LHGKKKIHAMWHLICERDIRAPFDIIEVDGDTGRVSLVDDYTFSSTGRKVHNVIESHFRFCDGMIMTQEDFCDARAWAKMALGGIKGFLAGKVAVSACI
jgi:uncharacterized protein